MTNAASAQAAAELIAKTSNTTQGVKMAKAQALAMLAVAEELAGLRHNIQQLIAVLTERQQG